MIDNYQPSDEQKKQLEFLLDLLRKSEQQGIKVWVFGGYGLDALYGKLTRDHRDFDLHISQKDKEAFLQLVISLGYYATSEKVGEVGKEVHKHPDLPQTFDLELGIVEKGQELVKNLGFKLNMPDKPVGNLEGQPIWTPDLEGFKIIIEINNLMAKKNNSEPYPHIEWQKSILKALE